MSRLDEAYMDAAARAVGLELPPSSRRGVLRFLSIAGEMAATLAEAPVDPRTLELAPTFRPPGASR